MSIYTIQLRYLVENNFGIFTFDYPIFDDNYKSVLEQKIIDHYYFQEIGLETPGQFRHFLKDKMNLIMPYYNQMYETENLITAEDYNKNLDSIEKHSKTVDNTDDSTRTANEKANGKSSGKDIFSDTPQGRLNSEDYATNLTDTSANSEANTDETETNKGTSKTIEEYTTELLGGGGVRYNSDVLMEWRKTFLKLDKMVIDELQDLFMNIY